MSNPHSASPEAWFDLAPFRQQERARQNLARMGSRVPQELLHALAPLLAESPDPDQALNLFERLVSESSEQLIRTLNHNRVLLHYTVAILGHSYWLGETLIHNQDIFYALQREKNLERLLGREDYRDHFARFRSHSFETDISTLLARFKKREYVRIALRDVLGISTIAETTEEISALSDVLIQEALREAEARMRNRYGEPQYQDSRGRMAEAPFAVLSLGKLGGNELNYSSDVDLLYVYGDHDSSDALTLREYFIRQAQALTEMLSRTTREGPVFRIDLRLRPQGGEGEPAVGLKHALNYYAHVAHDWELQALIKVRYSAGNVALARNFVHGVEPHVYSKQINFEAIETALLSRQRMGARRRRLVAIRKHPETIDVKLDRGGIRDIEFLAQCLQRVYGGEERWLRPGGTLFSLQKLHDKGHISGKEFHELTQAYQFLRRVEHRLQLQRAQQLHRLPLYEEELRVLERAVDRHATTENVNAFLFTLKKRMTAVSEIYDRIIHSQRQIEKEGVEAFRLTPLPSGSVRELSFDQVLQRIALDAPQVYEAAARPELSLHTRRSLHKFLSSAMTSAERYAALLENPKAVERALALLESSDFLTDILVRHPDVIRVLNNLPNSAAPLLFGEEQEDFFCNVDEARDTTEKLALMRRNYRRYEFASGARDILYGRPAYESMAENSRIADAAVQCALRVVGGAETLAVFALGRLGTDEFDIASDADLLFLRTQSTQPDEARSKAEKVMHALAAYTKEGTIFAVDARLRPRGGEGELVITPAELDKYLQDEAQPWEALTYTKLRFVAGKQEIASETVPLVHRQITRMAVQPKFAAAAVEMRARQEKSNRFARSFKLARGGFYDIDFVASYLMLKQTQMPPGTTDLRLHCLHNAGALDRTATEELRQAAMLYRTVDHAVRLVTGRARPELPAADHARKATEGLVNRALNRRNDLQGELEATAIKVREIFNRVLSAK
ncbi:MAG TPA: putative nucleotidyltransferase substrate binding domain-containing protein [Candidatus Angelobacter sp.]